MKSEPLYVKQRFPTRRLALVLAMPPSVMVLLLIWQVLLGHPWGKHPMSNGDVIGRTIFLWIIDFRLITVRLVTEVRDGELLVGLHGLWRARHVPLTSIQSVETIVFDPIRDYGGYGIRPAAGDRLIAEGRGVRLKLESTAALVVGSQAGGTR